VSHARAKTALVTGAARGIGRTVAAHLASQGIAVVVNCRKSVAAAEEVVAEIDAAGGRAVTVVADVSTAAGAAALVEAATEWGGPLDVVVNNVGDFVLKPLTDTTAQEWDEILRNNLSSAFYVSQCALPSMREAGYGRVVNLGSAPMNRLRAAGNVAPWAIAKAGVEILTRSMASEEASAGITVNCVAPGLMDNGHLTAAELEWLRQRVPAGRLGTTQEVAAAVAFLISPAASYISGATLSVSGGWDWDGRPDAAFDRAMLPAMFLADGETGGRR
jgi:NAD(P)-dependent dehydrogenase (short-subunit alcohol dehydrogenase family)